MEEQRPDWMKDELVKDIPAAKLDFLSQIFASDSLKKKKNQKEIMAFLLPAMKKAHSEGLTFTPQEMNAAIAAIKKHSTLEEQRRIDELLKKQLHT